MSGHRSTIASLARRLRPSSADFAAAAAPLDPAFLLQLKAARPRLSPRSGALVRRGSRLPMTSSCPAR